MATTIGYFSRGGRVFLLFPATIEVNTRVGSLRRVHHNHLSNYWRMGTRKTELIKYQKYLSNINRSFKTISFNHMPKTKNHFPDALATLASMLKSRTVWSYTELAYCNQVKVEQDGRSWYCDIKIFLKSRMYLRHQIQLIEKPSVASHANFSWTEKILY